MCAGGEEWRCGKRVCGGCAWGDVQEVCRRCAGRGQVGAQEEFLAPPPIGCAQLLRQNGIWGNVQVLRPSACHREGNDKA